MLYTVAISVPAFNLDKSPIVSKVLRATSPATPMLSLLFLAAFNTEPLDSLSYSALFPIFSAIVSTGTLYPYSVPIENAVSFLDFSTLFWVVSSLIFPSLLSTLEFSSIFSLNPFLTTSYLACIFWFLASILFWTYFSSFIFSSTVLWVNPIVALPEAPYLDRFCWITNPLFNKLSASVSFPGFAANPNLAFNFCVLFFTTSFSSNSAAVPNL